MFTANPLTGARDQVMINAAWGLGEAIVGGQVTPDTVVVEKGSGAITAQEIAEKDVMTVQTQSGTHEEPVPADRRTQAVLSPTQAADLARVGVQIEDLYGQPMDIEWALSDGRFFIVQARPITTLRAQIPATEEWNDNLSGDYLWSCANVGEAVPDVMTPCTWSLIQVFVAKTMGLFFSIGRRYHPIGNISGRYYMNVSLAMSASALFGVGRKRFLALTGEMFGRIPDDLEVPRIPLSRWRILRTIVPEAIHYRQRVRVNRKKLPAFLAEAPARCEALHARIQEASSAEELIGLWQAELEPFFHECCSMMEAFGGVPIRVRHTLRNLVGEADADVLLSGLNTGCSQLASPGPLLGLTQLSRGVIDRATFARQYGHRGPHEMEVSLPRPAEDPDWIDRQQAALREAPVDVKTLLARQKDAQAAAWERFQQRSPRRAARMRRRIDRAAAKASDREATRSELVRVFWALRAFVLHAGALTGQGEALFFLSINEILAVLGGDETALARIPARRATYARYCALPPYPTLIRGHFDPFQWAADPQRRVRCEWWHPRTCKRYDHWLPRRGWRCRGPGAGDRYSRRWRPVATRRDPGDDRDRCRHAVVTRRHRCARAWYPRRGGLWQCHDVPAHRRPGAGQRCAGHGRGTAGGGCCDLNYTSVTRKKSERGTDCDESEILELTTVMQV